MLTMQPPPPLSLPLLFPVAKRLPRSPQRLRDDLPAKHPPRAVRRPEMLGTEGGRVDGLEGDGVEDGDAC